MTDLRLVTVPEPELASTPSAPSGDIRRPEYTTELGRMYLSTIEQFLEGHDAAKVRGRVNLIFTSPPFALNRKKKYGNLKGDAYLEWFMALAPRLRDLLAPRGSLVIELGNAWEPGSPTMSTLALRSLLGFLDAGKLRLCQQFVCYNKATLPGPAEWVTIRRCRVKDAYTHVWWMAATDKPKANNRRVLSPYSDSMRKLLKTGKYNSGHRGSEHKIGEKSFLSDNGGAIPSNVITVANTRAGDAYQLRCKALGIRPHPARMAPEVPEFFIKLLTTPGDLVLDPFGGSNTTGAAAEKLRRKWIAVEPMPEYVLTSRARFPDWKPA